ncbi:MAG: HlyC/CorC family transporter [Bacteroidetes bacterium]|nr:HlyC/CorC family transporter [Bacteroidota bacterium]
MQIFALILSLVLIAFFSGIEIAFVSANRFRIELLKEKGSGSAKIVSEFANNASKFISSMLIGLNVMLVIFGSLIARLLDATFFLNHFGLALSDLWLLVIQTMVTTFVVLIFGELTPKILFRVNSDQLLLWFAYPTKYIFYVPLKPLSNLFHVISGWMIHKVVGVELVESQQVFTKEDLEYLVKETAVSEFEGDVETDHLNTDIFEKALYLKEIKVRNCMVPRLEIQGMDVSEGIDDLKKKFLDSKLSRLIVYQETIDKIIGYIHHFDLLKNPATIKQAVRSLPVIPESMTARDLMLQFIRDKKNIAWVVDEYGGTAGIITLEDLMEEIFGEIEDEHDVERLTEKKISESEYVFSGRIEVDYLNEKYDLKIPEGEYTTLSGYIVGGVEDIPDAGASLNLDQFRVKILKASDKIVELVNLQIIERDS